MLEDKVREVLLTPKKISSLVFYHAHIKYKADISKTWIILSKNTADSSPIAEYDIKSGMDFWYIDHICKSKKFNKTSDTCPACTAPDSKLEATPENIKIIATSGKYTPELSEILCHDILNYVNKYESCLKNI